MSLLELKNDIKNGNIKKVYLFYGPEDYLLNNYLKMLEDQVLGEGERTLNRFFFDGKTDEEKIMDACETYPVFSEKKIIIVKNASFFKGKKDKSTEKTTRKAKLKASKITMEEYIASLPDYLCLVFWEEEVDKRVKLFDCVKKAGMVVEFEYQNSKDLIKWIRSQFRSQNKEISEFIASYMIECCDPSMHDILNEQEKVVLYMGKETTVTMEHVEKVISKTLKTKIFDLTDYIGEKNTNRALQTAGEMINMKEPIPKILFFITRHFSNIIKYKEAQEKGLNPTQIASRLSLAPFIASKLAKQCRNFTKQKLMDAYEECLEIDAAIKSGKMGDQAALELFIVQNTL